MIKFTTVEEDCTQDLYDYVMKQYARFTNIVSIGVDPKDYGDGNIDLAYLQSLCGSSFTVRIEFNRYKESLIYVRVND